MASKKENEQKEIARLIDIFRKYSDEKLTKLINHRISAHPSPANKKAFKAVLKERGIDRNNI